MVKNNRIKNFLMAVVWIGMITAQGNMITKLEDGE